MTTPTPKDRSPFAGWVTDNPTVEAGASPKWLDDFAIGLGLKHIGAPPQFLFVGRFLGTAETTAPPKTLHERLAEFKARKLTGDEHGG